jgi:hypothetical protein
LVGCLRLKIVYLLMRWSSGLIVWVPETLSRPLTWCLVPVRAVRLVGHSAAGAPNARALSVFMSIRFAYLAVLRVFGRGFDLRA